MKSEARENLKQNKFMYASSRLSRPSSSVLVNFYDLCKLFDNSLYIKINQLGVDEQRDGLRLRAQRRLMI